MIKDYVGRDEQTRLEILTLAQTLVGGINTDPAKVLVTAKEYLKFVETGK